MSGWIDYNSDGVFDNATERAQIAVPNGSSDVRFTLTFPAIPAGSAGDDQRRVVTPPQAREWGVDFMVIGRPITRAENPTAAVDDILQSLS